MQKVFSLMEKAVKTTINVSITGETGTGKELVAKAIHYNSPRGKRPFITINVSAIPNDLIESELFGHEKGSFTGADRLHRGYFERANEGTLFLDEIKALVGNVPLTCHRAIDVSRDPIQVMEDLISLGFCRILTSGQKDRALDGLEQIADMVQAADGLQCAGQGLPLFG